MFNDILKNCESIWHKLKNTEKKIVLYGMGNGGDLIINELERIGVKISGVFASDDFVRGQSFRGFTVKKYSDFVREYTDFIVLTAFGSSRDEVIDNILKINNEQELYSVDVPVYGNNIFNDKFVTENKDKMKFVYERLADEKSKYIYENIIKFKYTGKIEFLINAESEKTEKYEILNLGDNEKYLDLGAYTGDTFREFCENVNGYEKIIAVEPDKKTFAKLNANVEKLGNIEIYNCCIGEKDGEIEFSAKAGRNSSRGKGKIIGCRSVDSILNGDGVTFIKADVEGMEKEMLAGCEETIKTYKPKMDIACYHRTEDIFEIPLRVLKIRDDYKIHIRHFKYVPCWDTSFYFI